MGTTKPSFMSLFELFSQDLTPEAAIAWIGEPTARVHVLLDNTGKTLSHAFVEVTGDRAKMVLCRVRNKVLGAGKRARYVTVTVSSDEELMAAVGYSLLRNSSVHVPVAFSFLGWLIPRALTVCVRTRNLENDRSVQNRTDYS